jgi:acetylornithine/succinyldiaminopimelate/putrescine aminotransferase
MTSKNDFLNYQAQTTPHPLAMEISHADGGYIYAKNGKAYLDFVAGVSACSLGHNPKVVVDAIKKQLDSYMHVMVYGEYIQENQLALSKLLAKNLPNPLNTVYLTNSGTEATEGALKLAKRVTGRAEIIAAKNAYHGNTQGAMSVCGAEEQNRAFRPLLPGVRFIIFNKLQDLEKITTKTAAVILETIQGGAGFIVPDRGYLQAVKKRCETVGALLILDEIQSGIGRTGKLFEFQNHNLVPDIVIAGKGLGGGMPIGAFIASKKHMNTLKEQPKLGHITTFGGHPVIASAGLATLQTILDTAIMPDVLRKEKLVRQWLNHPEIIEMRGKGLMLAALVKTPDLATKIILRCQDKGLILFWLLFEGRAIRITPPLNISDDDLKKGCDILLEAIDFYTVNN